MSSRKKWCWQKYYNVIILIRYIFPSITIFYFSKILTGQTLPTSGEIYLPHDYDLITGINKLERVGLCSQNNILIPNLTAKEHLQLYATLKIQSGYHAEVRRILESLKLGKYQNYKAQELSGGFKRRLCIANAFIGSPNLVILDEPCSGVDTKARKNIWELIENLRKGRAVVLATHYLDEAEQLSDSVVILNEGKIVAESTPEKLRSQFTKSFILKIKLPASSESESTLKELREVLQKNLSRYELSDCSSSELIVDVPYRNEDKEYNK